MSDSPIRALVIVFEEVEELEALAPVDILRRADVETTVASVDGSPFVQGRNGISFKADTSLSLVENDEFDLIYLPGGPGVLKLLSHAPLKELLARQDQRGGLLAAICAAPKAFAHFGLLNRCQAASHASVRDDLPHPSDAAIVFDGHIATSQGAGTAVEFSLRLVARLRGEDAARKVADSIHFAS